MNAGVTYGSELSAAHEALNQLIAHGLADRATTARHSAQLALGQLYRVLYRHAALITGNGRSPLPGALAAAARYSADPPTGGQMAEFSNAPPQLIRAFDHLTVAADILFSQIGPDGGARSPAGIALLAGVERNAHLASLAHIAAATATIHDQHRVDDALQATAAVFEDPVRRLDTIARTAAQPDLNSGTWLAAIRPIVDVSGDSWPAVDNHTGFREALDAARTWLAQHYALDLSGQTIRQLVGVGLALIQELGHIGLRYHEGLTSDLRARHITQIWRSAYHATDNIISLHPADNAAGPTALLNAERWLRQQLRTPNSWRPDALPDLNTGSGQQWLDTARALARALPDIATMLHHGARFSASHDRLYALDAVYNGSQLIRQPAWICADPRTPAIARLVTGLDGLRSSATLFCHLLDVIPHTGLHEAARANRQLAAEPSTHDRPSDTGPTSRLTRWPGIADISSVPLLPPATATLHTRVRRADVRGGETTRIPITLARGLVAEVERLQDEVYRLAARINDPESQTATGQRVPDQLASDQQQEPVVGLEPDATRSARSELSTDPSME
ncbi:hypothetical protein [Paractinoplanes hotanensis]|uniref:Uncharacterized protein n=1 Tax=Paractinoplanes hotanensis TaxID=2906497 RepID=A0ABT0Y822_9ACTN|nr:hypothetical protein [Actinoplanes hotanensis]MCM4082194.1 hypothetical protein [Actinoplanes hotanensis]